MNKMEELSDFYVTLSSNASFKFYPENSSTAFSNHLCRSIALSRNLYEVGIVQLIYEETPTTEVSNEIVIPKLTNETVLSTFLDDNDQDISVWKYAFTAFFIKNSALDISTLMLHLEKSMNPPIDLNLLLVFDGSILPKIKIIYKDHKSRRLELPKELANILGFDQTTFQPGEYLSVRYGDNKLYEKIAKQHEFYIRVSHWAETKLKIEEPEEYSYDMLIFTLSQTLETGGFHVAFDEKPDLLTVNILENDMHFKFPNKINKYLNLEKDFMFTKKSTQIVLTSAVENEKVKPIVEPLKQTNSSGLRLVLCDIVENQFYKDSSYPLLRSFRKPESRNTVADIQFSPVLYMNPERLQLQNIRLTIVDESLSIIPPTNTPTTAVLHFKQKSI